MCRIGDFFDYKNRGGSQPPQKNPQEGSGGNRKGKLVGGQGRASPTVHAQIGLIRAGV